MSYLFLQLGYFFPSLSFDVYINRLLHISLTHISHQLSTKVGRLINKALLL